MSQDHLFRKEVLASKRNQNYGSVFINTPVHYKGVTLGLSLIASLIIAWFFLAEYSEKFIVKGYLNSKQGIVPVYPRKNGVLLSSHAQVGLKVKKGDALFLIDTSYEGFESPHKILEQFKSRKELVKKEMAHKQQQLKQLKPLLDKHFISQTTYNASHEEWVVLKNTLAQINTELLQYQQERLLSILSPIDGTISSVNYQPGQYVDNSKPLIKILHEHDVLIAELYIPARQAGFINKNNKILLRYDAYPYERFGSYPAIIHTINESLLTDEEEDKPLVIGQPYYKINAKLSTPYVMAYGKKIKIRHGMTLSAVVIGSKRKVWQWVLDPLYSLYGELWA